jgi:multimeric flavodoxin WrbA
MKMKIIGFVGSPRKGGNTDELVRQILKGAQAGGGETKVYFLNDLSIRECQACMVCKKSSEGCSQKDDMFPLYDEIRSAHGLILGSPIYMGYMTGLMKIFLDRWYALARSPEGKQLPRGKRIILAFSYRRPEKDLFLPVAKQVGQALKFVFGAEVASLLVEGVEHPGDVLQKRDIMEQAFQMGRDLTRPEGGPRG